MDFEPAWSAKTKLAQPVKPHTIYTLDARCILPWATGPCMPAPLVELSTAVLSGIASIVVRFSRNTRHDEVRGVLPPDGHTFWRVGFKAGQG